MVLRDLQELSYQEIADRLGLPEGTVKSRINRGRIELARQLRRLQDKQPAAGAGGALPLARGPGDPECLNEPHYRTRERDCGRARRRIPADVSAPLGVLVGRTQLINAGERRVVVDLSAVGYVDSATIGCLMDLYRQASAAGGALKLAGVQKRVETMLTMTGAQNFIEVHPDEPSAVKSFGV